MTDRLDRKSFMALGAAASAMAFPVAAEAQPGPAPSPAPLSPPAPSALGQALVLSGGGALGAYEAGIVDALVRARGVQDGQPLPPYGLVCGTSIGAFNAYLVATAQYSKLRSLWGSIAREGIIRLKPEYQKIYEQSAGVLSRFYEQLAMVVGLRKNVKGVLDSDRLRAFLVSYFDFSRPVVMPMIWAVTNLTAARPEYFYLLPESATGDRLKIALDAIRLAVGPGAPIRPATRELLVDQLRASAAVPVAFDPVVLPSTDGKDASYVDGGITANTPIRVAAGLALRIDVVLLNPAFDGATTNNAVEIASASFDTMQRRLMEDALRSAYFEAFALRALRQLPQSFTDDVARTTGISPSQLAIMRNALYETNIYALRPQSALPVSIFGFQDEAAIEKTYAIGQRDGAGGFVRFDPVAYGNGTH